MARRDDGNEPIRIRPPRSVASREQEILEKGSSPAPLEPQEDFTPSASPSSPGVTKTAGPIDFSFIPDICVTGLQPADVTSSIIRLLQGHFSKASNIRHPELRELVWSPSSDSNLFISSSTYVRQPESSKLPRLIVKRGSQSSKRVVAGDRGAFTNVDAHVSTSGYSRWVLGNARVGVIAESGHVCDLLSEEVYLGLTFIAPKVIAQTPFYDFQVVSLMGVEPTSNVGDSFMSGVDISYIYETSWVTTDIAPTLQGLNTTTQVVK